jgi:hypothetical protein
MERNSATCSNPKCKGTTLEVDGGNAQMLRHDCSEDPAAVRWDVMKCPTCQRTYHWSNKTGEVRSINPSDD